MEKEGKSGRGQGLVDGGPWKRMCRTWCSTISCLVLHCPSFVTCPRATLQNPLFPCASPCALLSLSLTQGFAGSHAPYNTHMATFREAITHNPQLHHHFTFPFFLLCPSSHLLVTRVLNFRRHFCKYFHVYEFDINMNR